jgi:hypothetical protein
LTVLPVESEEEADLMVKMGTHFRMENPKLAGLKEGCIALGRTSVGEMDPRVFVKDGNRWWADVSNPGKRTFLAGFDGDTVWFRFDEKVMTLPRAEVDTFNVSIAEPFGLRNTEEIFAEGLVYLGKEDYLGECHVFAQEREEPVIRTTRHYVDHYYFDVTTGLLKKKELFWQPSESEEACGVNCFMTGYSIEELSDGADPAMFSLPTEEGLVFEKVEPPHEGEMCVNIGDGIGGKVQALFRLHYDGGKWGIGGLN